MLFVAPAAQKMNSGTHSKTHFLPRRHREAGDPLRPYSILLCNTTIHCCPPSARLFSLWREAERGDGTNKEQHNTRRVTEEEEEKTTWVGREGGLQIGSGLLIREGRGKKGDGVRKSRNTAMTEGDLRDQHGCTRGTFMYPHLYSVQERHASSPRGVHLHVFCCHR